MGRAWAVRRRAAELAGVLCLSAALAACDVRPEWEREALGRDFFDSTGTYVHAGVSARTDAEVDPLRPATLGADTTTRAFDLYAMRCGSCHAAPDPGMKKEEHWSFLIDRMRDKTGTAGLIPMTRAEADTILDLLRRHARR